MLTADSMISTDTESSRPIAVETTNESGTQALTSFTVPKKSMVVLYLEPLS